MTVLELVLVGILAAAVSYVAIRWLFKLDTKIENRRRGAAKLALALKSYGLVRVPDLLVDYSVGDYSGMAEKIKSLTELFLSGEKAVLTEFDQVFDRVLVEKLKCEAGRALIASRLSDAVQGTDPSSVEKAPLPAVLG